ncbi:lactate dehydrogenase [Fructilactobacillus lindneri]|uniref:Lactate dehydrogenase n=1 Tax=Fructilactobacillus lindneri TaxID=53444 RepID=A0AB33BGM8_9LACO|nr:D-2-hydroxyacid dehydrogenase [Fructilactobacillus lindneri]ANZ57507.1 lactate dehydrogenase [Fructilactobacillus lindneri]ANZ58775.1 lactate dehydrogenase [Fructilactobacillus lindneri]POG97797.1 lactate dehydrogenase [Fructilactobacillus lindneri]POG99129.1 lactate dehydrogenase [Fructilactobacillus lindneri]POH01292.1 lactate dehydrogenase [Fructilactobacillus lindneri]
MTKILMYSVRADEKPAIKQWSRAHQVTVDTTNHEFHDETVAMADGYDGIVIQQRGPISADDKIYSQLAKMGIKQLTTRTAGVDVINLSAAKAAGLVVTNVPAYSPNSVAEMSVTQTMRLIRNLEIVEKRSDNNDYKLRGPIARELRTLTVGIIGAGRIGGTAARLFNALGANVIAYDPVHHDELKDVLTYVDTKNELLNQADVVDLHVDLNETSRGLIDADALQQMKSDAFLVNASRGPVVVTDALINALQNKEIAGAALDTIEGEAAIFDKDLQGSPIPDKNFNALHAMPNVIITPHIGFYTNMAVQNMVEISLNDVLAIINNQPVENEVK